jgi:hypothetical protein
MARKIEPRPDFDFDNAIDRAREDPIAAADELRAVSPLERLGNELAGLQHIATGCEIFQSLQRGDEQERTRFFEKVKEAGVKHQPRKHRELTVTLLYGMPHASYATCLKAAAAGQLLMDDGVEPKDIPARIKAEEGGIEALYNRSPGKAKARSRKQSALPAASTHSVSVTAEGTDAASEHRNNGADHDQTLTSADSPGEATQNSDNGTAVTETTGSTDQKQDQATPARSITKSKEYRDAMKSVCDVLERGLHPLVIAASPDVSKYVAGIYKREVFSLLDIEKTGEIERSIPRLEAKSAGYLRKKKP